MQYSTWSSNSFLCSCPDLSTCLPLLARCIIHSFLVSTMFVTNVISLLSKKKTLKFFRDFHEKYVSLFQCSSKAVAAHGNPQELWKPLHPSSVQALFLHAIALFVSSRARNTSCHPNTKAQTHANSLTDQPAQNNLQPALSYYWKTQLQKKATLFSRLSLKDH